MTEEEWRTGTGLEGMVAFAASRVSRRKLLLFACAVAETVIHDPTTMEGEALELVERFADGALATEPVEEADVLLMRTRLQQEHWRRLHLERQVAERLLDVAEITGAVRLEEEVQALLGDCRFGRFRWRSLDNTKEPVDPPLLARLRDIAGDPFRPAAVRPEWLVANGGQLPRLARAVYDERRYKELPCLADALEDAGCADEAILGHLRGGGPHVRGCWALDLLLELY